VIEVNQDLQALPNDVVAGMVPDLCDEANAACIMFVQRVIQALFQIPSLTVCLLMSWTLSFTHSTIPRASFAGNQSGPTDKLYFICRLGVSPM
jgi:hypothetical protein